MTVSGVTVSILVVSGVAVSGVISVGGLSMVMSGLSHLDVLSHSASAAGWREQPDLACRSTLDCAVLSA